MILCLQPDRLYGLFSCWLLDFYVLCPLIVEFFLDNITLQGWTAALS